MSNESKNFDAGLGLMLAMYGMSVNLVANYFDRTFVKYGVWYDLAVVIVFLVVSFILIQLLERILDK